MTVREANLAAASSADRKPEIIESGGTARLHLTLATADYDHVRDLVNGVVRAEGTVLTAFVLPVEEIFYRFIKNREWDVSEMSFGKFIGYAALGNSPFVGIPVFPSRVFRHSAFYVRADRGIASPKDLEGKTVGIPEWAQTAGIYVRGMLAHEYGVDLARIQWFQAGVREPGRVEKVSLNLPRGVTIAAHPDRSLVDMLAKGDLDAVMSAREVPGARLFKDYRTAEAEYWKKTRIFPIMLDQIEGFPELRDRMIYLAVHLRRSDNPEKSKFALIEVPSDVLPRFLILPREGKKQFVVLLDDVHALGARVVFLIRDDRHHAEDRDDRDHEHQLDQGEPRTAGGI